MKVLKIGKDELRRLAAARSFLEREDIATDADFYEGIAKAALAELLSGWISMLDGGWEGKNLRTDVDETLSYIRTAFERFLEKMPEVEAFVRATAAEIRAEDEP